MSPLANSTRRGEKVLLFSFTHLVIFLAKSALRLFIGHFIFFYLLQSQVLLLRHEIGDVQMAIVVHVMGTRFGRNTVFAKEVYSKVDTV